MREQEKRHKQAMAKLVAAANIGKPASRSDSCNDVLGAWAAKKTLADAKKKSAAAKDGSPSPPPKKRLRRSPRKHRSPRKPPGSPSGTPSPVKRTTSFSKMKRTGKRQSKSAGMRQLRKDLGVIVGSMERDILKGVYHTPGRTLLEDKFEEAISPKISDLLEDDDPRLVYQCFQLCKDITRKRLTYVLKKKAKQEAAPAPTPPPAPASPPRQDKEVLPKPSCSPHPLLIPSQYTPPGRGRRQICRVQLRVLRLRDVRTHTHTHTRACALTLVRTPTTAPFYSPSVSPNRRARPNTWCTAALNVTRRTRRCTAETWCFSRA